MDLAANRQGAIQLASADFPLPRFSYAHEPGATAVVDQSSSTFSAGQLPTNDVG